MSHQQQPPHNDAMQESTDSVDRDAYRRSTSAQQPVSNSSNHEQSRAEEQNRRINTERDAHRAQELDGFTMHQPTHGMQANVSNPYMFPHYSAPGPIHYQSYIFPPPSSGISAAASESEDPLPPPSNQLQRVAVPAAKVAGSRRPDPKGKGKQKAVDDEQPVASGSGTKRKATSHASQADPKKFRGRSSGSPNYSSDDVDLLLDTTESLKPVGGNGWLDVERAYNTQAAELDRPQRSARSLELKFKQLVKTTKPTGDAECPPHILRAHEIDDAINEKVGTRDLDDEDIVDAFDDSSEPTAKPPTLVLRRTAADSRSAHSSSARHSRATSQGMLANISAALDPSRLQARHEEQSILSLQSNQIFQLTSQLREAQRRADTLSSQLFEAERRAAAAERQADMNQLMGMISDRGHSHLRSPFNHQSSMSSSRSRYSSHVPSSRRRSHPPRERRRYRQDIFYSDGGQATRWVGGSSDEEDVLGMNDSPGTRRHIDLNDSIILPPRCTPSPLPSLSWSPSPTQSPRRRGDSSSRHDGHSNSKGSK